MHTLLKSEHAIALFEGSVQLYFPLCSTIWLADTLRALKLRHSDVAGKGELWLLQAVDLVVSGEGWKCKATIALRSRSGPRHAWVLDLEGT